jgi:hypothetical protein
VLRHVCFDAHRLHFFGNPSAATRFGKLMHSYRVWDGPGKPKQQPPEWRVEVVHHADSTANFSSIMWINETSFLQVPHRAIDNMFHFHNNFLLPLMLNVVLTGSDRIAKHLYLFKTWPLASSALNSSVLARPRPWPWNTTHPAFFNVLSMIFDKVVWPVNDLWDAGHTLCFRRFVWAQRLTPHTYPYYNYASTDRAYQGVRALARTRDMIRGALGLATVLTQATPDPRPAVVWISRQPTCFSSISKNSLGRCIANLDDVLERMRRTQRFASVSALSDFALREDAQLRSMLLRSQLKLLQGAGIMVGVHGAGLTHILYLNERSAVVELRDHFWHESGGRLLIYETMARMQGCGYISADIRHLEVNHKQALPSVRSYAGYALHEHSVAAISEEAEAEWRRAQDTSRPGPMLGRCCYKRWTTVVCKCHKIDTSKLQ